MRLVRVMEPRVDGDALLSRVEVVETSVAWDRDGTPRKAEGPAVTVDFSLTPSDVYGLSPQVREYVSEHASDFTLEVQRWIKKHIPKES